MVPKIRSFGWMVVNARVFRYYLRMRVVIVAVAAYVNRIVCDGTEGTICCWFLCSIEQVVLCVPSVWFRECAGVWAPRLESALYKFVWLVLLFAATVASGQFPWSWLWPCALWLFCGCTVAALCLSCGSPVVALRLHC